MICAEYVEGVSADQIRGRIKNYMSFFRDRFPSVKIIPKQHILECHCFDFMSKWGFGLSLHGELGGEETQATIIDKQ